ncbi:uncharacterized protein [Rutidosis leptorrhynchoides]|uniref:uncharacterized protein n=1 Tax=Rutidosis leptorrhynchoides TaxID=125765 RepID=UPI003A98F5D5
MNNLEKSISELHLMLKIAEKNIPSKTSEVLMIREEKIKKSQGKGKEIGHWKRNCPTYLAELKKTKASNASTSGIYMIELFAFSSNSWVFDTGYGTHICNNAQGLRKIK